MNSTSRELYDMDTIGSKGTAVGTFKAAHQANTTVLVFEFGGGTFDVSLLTIEDLVHSIDTLTTKDLADNLNVHIIDTIGDTARNQLTTGNTVFDAKRMIDRDWSDKAVQNDIKFYPFKKTAEAYLGENNNNKKNESNTLDIELSTEALESKEMTKEFCAEALVRLMMLINLIHKISKKMDRT